MGKDKFDVKCCNEVIAENMEIDVACEFAAFLFEKWYNEDKLEITIVRRDRP